MDTVSYGGESVYVWAAITRSSKSKLVILRQTVNKDSYKVVLRDYLLPWATANLGDPQRDWKLQDDNAPPHRARDVEEEKRRLGVRTIPWPSRSPDLNPTEHAQPANFPKNTSALEPRPVSHRSQGRMASNTPAEDRKACGQHASTDQCCSQSQGRLDEVLTSTFSSERIISPLKGYRT